MHGDVGSFVGPVCDAFYDHLSAYFAFFTAMAVFALFAGSEILALLRHQVSAAS